MTRGITLVAEAGVILLFVAFAPASHAFRSVYERDRDLRGCPRSVQAAKNLASMDAHSFRKRYSAGTWPGFLHLYRHRVRRCPSFIRRAYRKRAHELLVPDAKPEYTRIRSIKSGSRGL
jgi:hypothetical protein